MGTLLLVLLRLSYHAYYGLAVIILVSWAWLTIRLYRHTRSLTPLITGHALFYVFAFLEPAHQFAALLVTGRSPDRRHHQTHPRTGLRR